MGGPGGKPRPQAHHRLLLPPPQHYSSGRAWLQVCVGPMLTVTPPHVSVLVLALPISVSDGLQPR